MKKARLHKQLPSPYPTQPVQPNEDVLTPENLNKMLDHVQPKPARAALDVILCEYDHNKDFAKALDDMIAECIDADGNVIPEY